MCYFIVLMSSLLFYNVENSQNKEKPLNVGVSKLLTGTVCTVYLSQPQFLMSSHIQQSCEFGIEMCFLPLTKHLKTHTH